MARYKIEFHTEKSADALNPLIGSYLSEHGFSSVVYQGENVFLKKGGAFKLPQYIKITYKSHALEVEAFVKNWILPFIFVGENSISDKQDKSEEALYLVVENLVKLIKNS